MPNNPSLVNVPDSTPGTGKLSGVRGVTLGLAARVLVDEATVDRGLEALREVLELRVEVGIAQAGVDRRVGLATDLVDLVARVLRQLPVGAHDVLVGEGEGAAARAVRVDGGGDVLGRDRRGAALDDDRLEGDGDALAAGAVVR